MLLVIVFIIRVQVVIVSIAKLLNSSIMLIFSGVKRDCHRR